MYWMIHPSLENELERIYAHTLTAEQLAATAASDQPPMTVVDGVASIPIVGPLVAERSRFLDFFDVPHTAYPDITASVREAEANPEVRKIEFRVNSGGGVVSNALNTASDAIFNASKPTVAVVGDMAASAAYWLTSQADEIVLSGPATMVGSIGVVTERFVMAEIVTITSTDAPKKRPDASTEAGRADIRSFLDDLHALFVADVVRGRGVSAEKVNSDFGMGGVLLAGAAVKAGMADRVIGTGAEASQRDTVARMDRDSLIASHPELYAACVAEGVAKERTRVSAHLTLAKASGKVEAAVDHIRSGVSSLDEGVVADYRAAGMAQARQESHESEQPPDLKGTKLPVEDAEDKEIRAMFAEAGLKGEI